MGIHGSGDRASRDERDGHQRFRCCDIDPTVLPNSTIRRLRVKGYVMFFTRRFLRHPVRSFGQLWTFSQYMRTSDVVSLLLSPLRGRAPVGGPNPRIEPSRPLNLHRLDRPPPEQTATSIGSLIPENPCASV